MKRLGLYGGSFNPPHLGHQTALLYGIETANVELVLVAPVYQHPYGKELAPFNERLAMCHGLTRPFNHHVVGVSLVEKLAFEQGGQGLTINTVKLLFDRGTVEKDGTIVLIVGDDVAADMAKWEGYDKLKELMDVGRLEVCGVPRPHGLSSTMVRARIARGEDVRTAVPREVHAFIESRGLYR